MMKKKFQKLKKGWGMGGEACEHPVLAHNIDPKKVILKLLSKIFIGTSSVGF